MTTLKEFLTARRAEIKSQISSLREELKEIDAACVVVGLDKPTSPKINDDNSSKPTIKTMVLDVLSNRPQGADASTIIDLVKEKYEIEIPRTSLSPQISRLGHDGLLHRRGMMWYPVNQQEKNKASEWDNQTDASEVAAEVSASAISAISSAEDIIARSFGLLPK